MPWFAWIAIVGIVVFGITQVISMATGRPLPSGSRDEEELDELRERVRALEQEKTPEQLEEPRIPTKAEENLAAEDRWRLDMLEARVESLERGAGPDADGEGPHTRDQQPDDDESPPHER